MNSSSNKNNNISSKEVNDYLNVLSDAVVQRSTPEQLEHYHKTANCVCEIFDIFKKYKLKDIDDIVHILVSVVVIPVEMMEPNSITRSKLLQEIAHKMLVEVMMTQVKDTTMADSETGKELDRLRQMMHETNAFSKKLK